MRKSFERKEHTITNDFFIAILYDLKFGKDSLFWCNGYILFMNLNLNISKKNLQKKI